MSGERERARAAFLRTFEWIDGHASFSGAFLDAETFGLLAVGLAEPFRESRVTAVISPEARGFLLGGLCAMSLGVGFVGARKPGVLRVGEMVEVVSQPDWRGRRIQFSIPRVLTSEDRVLLVDDWIETGSQASAIAGAVNEMGATFVGVSTIVDQAPTSIRSDLKVVGLVRYDELPGQD